MCCLSCLPVPFLLCFCCLSCPKTMPFLPVLCAAGGEAPPSLLCFHCLAVSEPLPFLLCFHRYPASKPPPLSELPTDSPSLRLCLCPCAAVHSAGSASPGRCSNGQSATKGAVFIIVPQRKALYLSSFRNERRCLYHRSATKGAVVLISPQRKALSFSSCRPTTSRRASDFVSCFRSQRPSVLVLDEATASVDVRLPPPVVAHPVCAAVPWYVDYNFHHDAHHHHDYHGHHHHRHDHHHHHHHHHHHRRPS